MYWAPGLSTSESAGCAKPHSTVIRTATLQYRLGDRDTEPSSTNGYRFQGKRSLTKLFDDFPRTKMVSLLLISVTALVGAVVDLIRAIYDERKKRKGDAAVQSRNALGIVPVIVASLWTSLAGAAEQGWYVGAQAGSRMLEDAENSGSGADITSTTKNGYSLAGSAGYRFGSGLRTDAELAYGHNGLGDLRIRADGGLGAALGLGSFNGATLKANGHLSAVSLLGNAWYDIDLGKLKPYFGGGLGGANISAGNVSVGPVTIANNRDTVFAFQLGAGVGYELLPAIVLTMDYRYLRTSDPTFRDLVLGTNFRSEYRAHDLRLGARYQF
jgi:outer membrane immunogenic protein